MLKDQSRLTHLRSIKDLQAAERHGAKVAIAKTAKLRRLVLRIIKSGQIPMEFVSDIVAMYQEPVLEAMQTADLLGRKRAWITAETSGLKLGDIHTAAVKFFLRHDDTAASEALDAHTTRALQVVTDLAKNIETKLRDSMRESVLQGEHIKDSKKRLAATMDSLGLSPRNSGQIEALVRTQTQLAFSAGRYKAERMDPDIDEMLWGYKYVTAGDSRVRDEHKNLDGVVLPKDHKFWDTFMPPNGFNCRCQAIPLYDQRPVKFPPRDAEPDKTFNFNPGRELYGVPVPRPVKPVIDVPAGAPSTDRLAAATANFRPDDIRRLLNGENVAGVRGERAQAILQALARAQLNPQKLYRGPTDHRGGVLEFTTKKLDNPAEVLEKETARAIKIGPYRWIADTRK